ncbi:hypothetical protein RI367_004497 [Sorochytrium milnesiophthora]
MSREAGEAHAFKAEQEVEETSDVAACQWADCHIEFGDLKDLVEHLTRDHIGNKRSGYACEWRTCPRRGISQTSRFSLIAHMRSHTGEKPFDCPLPECDKSFSRSDALTKHMRVQHNDYIASNGQLSYASTAALPDSDRDESDYDLPLLPEDDDLDELSDHEVHQVAAASEALPVPLGTLLSTSPIATVPSVAGQKRKSELAEHAQRIRPSPSMSAALNGFTTPSVIEGQLPSIDMHENLTRATTNSAALRLAPVTGTFASGVQPAAPTDTTAAQPSETKSSQDPDASNTSLVQKCRIVKERIHYLKGEHEIKELEYDNLRRQLLELRHERDALLDRLMQ